MYPQILFWKWDEQHLRDRDIIHKIKDINERSCFTSVYIGAAWTEKGICDKHLVENVKEACQYLHSIDKKIIYELDVRSQYDRQAFAEQYKDSLLAIAVTNEIILDQAGCGAIKIEKKDNCDQFGIYKALSADILKTVVFEAEGFVYSPNSLVDLTKDTFVAEDSIYFDFGPKHAYKKVFCIYTVEYDTPDPMSDNTLKFLENIFEAHKDIPLDGVAIDEWGYIPHPDFNYSVAWKQPWYSRSIQDEINKKFNIPIADFYFQMYYKPGDGLDNRVKYINYYNEMIRQSTLKLENYYYNKAKDVFGKDCFIGVHPTWYAIDRVNNYPEIYKNGFNWWEVPRDFGFTDEICPYPIRTALTHKSGGNIWYNMWYGESTLDLITFTKEIWTNARYGGRVISLGYEVRKENVTTEFVGDGKLEYISSMEEKIALLNQFQTASVNCSVLIVFGIYAACNWIENVHANARWNCYDSNIIDAFTLANDLWVGGYNCDLVPSYEVDNGSVYIGKNGKAVYGTQEYESVIFIHLEYSKGNTFEFMKKLKNNIIQIGAVTKDFYGEPVEGISGLVQLYFQTRPEIGDIIFYLKNHNIPTNRVPYGSVLQDGSIIITNSGVKEPVENDIEVEFKYKNVAIKIKCKDIFAIKIDGDGKVEKLLSNKIDYLLINDKAWNGV